MKDEVSFSSLIHALFYLARDTHSLIERKISLTLKSLIRIELNEISLRLNKFN